MIFDFKREYKKLYIPGGNPEIVDVPKVNYIAVWGQGNPNEENGTYQNAINILYAVAYTIKMSKKGEHKIPGFYDFIVPPLEGFWWQENGREIDYSDKSAFQWISIIRLPEFVTRSEFDWAVTEASRKKKMDCSRAEYMTVEEGLCVQVMHIGSFENELETIARMDKFLEENGYENDINELRRHHEIYLSDVRKVASEKWKTVIRHPIRNK